jgi:hypothetical protein
VGRHLGADNQNGIVGSFLQISGGFRCMSGAWIRAGAVRESAVAPALSVGNLSYGPGKGSFRAGGSRTIRSIHGHHSWHSGGRRPAAP